MILTTLHPPATDAIDLSADDARARLIERYRPPRDHWLRINLITSISGNAAGSDGTSESLTNPTDRLILGVIRELADVVLVGAESVRREGYRVPKRTPLAILTASGNLEGHRLERDAASRVIVIGPNAALRRASAALGDVETIALPSPDRSSAREIVDALGAAGHHSIACEGGPHLAAQLVAAGLVDEVCLTTSPRLTAVGLPAFGEAGFAERSVALTQLLRDERDALYARWAITS